MKVSHEAPVLQPKSQTISLAASSQSPDGSALLTLSSRLARDIAPQALV